MEPLDEACDHNVMFGLMYLRTTEEYQRVGDHAGLLHRPAASSTTRTPVFARYYFDAWDAYRAAASRVSEAWKIAFQNADAQKVSRHREHVPRHVGPREPRPAARARLRSAWSSPTGRRASPTTTRSTSSSITVIEPLFDEAAARFDPTRRRRADGRAPRSTRPPRSTCSWPGGSRRGATPSASSPPPPQADRAAVIAEIERQAAIEANLLVVATSYSSLNVQAALDAARRPRRHPSADVLQAQADRTVNQAPWPARQPLQQPRHRPEQLLRRARIGRSAPAHQIPRPSWRRPGFRHPCEATPGPGVSSSSLRRA